MTRSIFQYISLFVLLLSCKTQPGKVVVHKANFIDSIQTAKQLNDFIPIIYAEFKNFKVNESLEADKSYSDGNVRKIADSLSVRPWTKADFDSNGLTDILVIGSMYRRYVICILDQGNNHYEIKSLTRRDFDELAFPVVAANKINYYYQSHPDRSTWDKPRNLESHVLTYKFGDFVEENQSPATHKIERIEYATSACFGTCPIFNLTIHSDKTANWFADMYNEVKGIEVNGDFISSITTDKYNEIVNLLNYIDFSGLHDKYEVNWTDDQTATLTITYDNGKVKTISDYGLIGTYGLDRLHQLLFNLRENQKWAKK